MLLCVQQIAEAQLEGTPADAFLSLGPKADAEADATAEQVRFGKHVEKSVTSLCSVCWQRGAVEF
jgi:hypothetical protein